LNYGKTQLVKGRARRKRDGTGTHVYV